MHFRFRLRTCKVACVGYKLYNDNAKIEELKLEMSRWLQLCQRLWARSPCGRLHSVLAATHEGASQKGASAQQRLPGDFQHYVRFKQSGTTGMRHPSESLRFKLTHPKDVQLGFAVSDRFRK